MSYASWYWNDCGWPGCPTPFYDYSGALSAGFWRSPNASLRLSTLSPMQSWTEPLTEAQCLKQIELEYGSDPDTAVSDELSLMASAARATAELFQNRDLVRKKWDMTRDGWQNGQGGSRIFLRDPLVSVDLVQYYDADGVTQTLVENTDYWVDRSSQFPSIVTATGKSWPALQSRPQPILIRFTSGPLPDDIWWRDRGAIVKRGMLAMVSHWYDNRDAWTRGIGAVEEFPFAATDLLSAGALDRAQLF